MNDLTYNLPKLYKAQQRAFMCDERYSVCEASTKSGKTAGCMIWLLAEAITKGRDGREFWWVAPTYGVAMIAFKRIKRMLLRADPQKKTWNYVKTPRPEISLANGAILVFLGSDDPDNLYGEDVWAAVIDEATRCKEEAWHAVRSTLTHTKGRIRIIGNVKGRNNWAYKLARLAEGGEVDMKYSRLTAYDAVDAGVLDLDEVEDAKRKLPDDTFRQLYLAEPADDGGNPFGLKSIRAGIRPMSMLTPVCFGIDLAKSYDWTVVIGLDAGGDVCVFDRWQRADWPQTEARILAQVNGWPTLIDATGVGASTLDHLQQVRPNIGGFIFSSTSKQSLMMDLACAIHQQSIGYPDGEITNELEVFEYEYTRTGVKYSAPEGLHDDCVCALALANRQRSVPKVWAGVVDIGRSFYDNDEDDD